MPTRKGYFATVPPQEILPIVDGGYESSVKGIFVIGDVTGLPLVKVAANHGVEVLETMRQKGRLAGDRQDADRLDLVIIGAGPAGLSAAIEAQRQGLRYVVLERAVIANTIHSFPPGKQVYSEPRFLKNNSALPAENDLPKEAFLEEVRQLAKTENLHIQEGVEVTRVLKRGDRHFDVETSRNKTFSAQNIILAVGRQGNARTLGVPGEELSHKVTYRLHTPEDYHGKKLLIVGGGNSAVEAALMLCDTNDVTLSYRQDAFFRLKDNNRDALEEAQHADRLTVILNSELKAIREAEVDLEVAGELQTFPNDHVLIFAGTLPPIDFLRAMGLELDGIWTPKRVVWSVVGILLGCFVYFGAKYFYLLDTKTPEGGITIPGFGWLFAVIPDYFANLYGFYYLLYFTLIAVFGIYWAVRYKNRIVWRRNLCNIFFNWTLWWGIPAFLIALIGRNVWSPLMMKSLNAWPLNMSAFHVEPVVQQGDPAFWHVLAVVGVVWAVVLTFIILPVFTVLFGKYYCSHLCSCGALAETVGNSFRHRGPKSDTARWLERLGYIFIPLAAVATIADILGYGLPLRWYNVWVGTFLAGALAIGLYPFLGQRIWCRYWCPLAFWMNFWGRWSRFKISPEPGKCIDCNVCNQFCQMGIDIKSRALKGVPVTLKDTPCVACGECVARCPMEILHLGELPEGKPYAHGTDAGAGKTIDMPIHSVIDIPKMNERSVEERK